MAFNCSRFTLLHALFMCFWLSFQTVAYGDEPLCANVKIEIMQELTLERQAFEATMRVHNELDSYALESIRVDIIFQDAEGSLVLATSNASASDAKFFINLDDASNVTGYTKGVAGAVSNGRIAPKTTGIFRWLIIPTAGAAGDNPAGALFFVGARLEYTFGGKTEVVNVAPDTIVVKPQPKLTLDYFLTSEVIGDDAFTEEIEPPVPYTLGLRIHNTGVGPANKVSIESAQPRIIENDQGLAVGFKILGSYMGSEPASPSLRLNYGQINSDQVKIGRWVMETTLSGRFVDFNATVSHSDELGGELTSLIETANTHFLIKDVKANVAGRDSVSDFLALTDTGSIWLYESEATNLHGPNCRHCSEVTSLQGLIEGPQSLEGFTVRRLIATESTDQFGYLKVADPYGGSKQLARVERANGHPLLKDNFWISQERSADKINFNYFINVFDHATADHYVLYFTELNAIAKPPVIQFIPDKTTYEGGSIGFIVRASDPNNDPITLTANSLPIGASFADEGGGKGVFYWSPTVGQAGQYPIKFEASDGQLKDEFTVIIKVNPEYDKDGDGMDDAWELKYFGTLDRDGTGDYDGDGYTDLEEFLNGTDPTVKTYAPLAPTHLFPANSTEVAVLGVTLGFNNSKHEPEVVVLYEVQVFTDSQYTQLVWSNSSVSEAESGITSVQIFPELEDNRHYYWRVRALSAEGNSIWVYRQFFVNTENDPPTKPVLLAPDNHSVLSTLTPVLKVVNPIDVDGDALELDFYVFQSDNLDVPVAQALKLTLAVDGVTQWKPTLDDNQMYYWYVVVRDEHGLEVSSDAFQFFLNMENDAPTEPVALSPLQGAEVNSDSVDLIVVNATDVDSFELFYEFQLDISPSFDSEEMTYVHSIPEGSDGQTAWNALFLKDSTVYYWRARAFDGELYSPWVFSTFVADFSNEPPPTPSMLNPISNATVATLFPTLKVSAVADPEGDSVLYQYELYDAGEVSEELLVWSFQSANTSVQVPEVVVLQDNSIYYWRVRAVDNNSNSSAWSELESFRITLLSEINVPPHFSWLSHTSGDEILEDVVMLRWEVYDPDSNALVVIKLIYDSGEQMILLETTEEAGPTEFKLDKNSLPVGRFTVVALVSDEVNSIEVVGASGIVSEISAPGEIKLIWSETTVDEFQVQPAILTISLEKELLEGEYLTLTYALSNPEAAFIWTGNFSNRPNSGVLTFTTSNWAEPQYVEVRGLDNCELDGDRQHSFVFTGIDSNSKAYEHINQLPVQSLTTVDNEIAGAALQICEYSIASQSLVEGGVLYSINAKLRNQTEKELYQVIATPMLNGIGQHLPNDTSISFNSIAAHTSKMANQLFTVTAVEPGYLNLSALQWSFDVIEAPVDEEINPPVDDIPPVDDTTPPPITQPEKPKKGKKSGSFSWWMILLIAIILGWRIRKSAE